MPKHIAFTGHRDRLCDEHDLEALANEFPGAVWVNGGAIGFDRQVEQYAVKHKIPTRIIRPEYEKYGKVAHLRRNDLIVDAGEILVALWDGRKYGGTWYTICKAMEFGKGIRLLKPV